MKPRLVIAVIVLLAGGVMAVRALLPLLPKREPVVVYTPEGLTPFDEVRFESARTGRTARRRLSESCSEGGTA